MFRALVDSSPWSVLVVTPDHFLIEASANFLAFVHKSRAKAIGRHMSEVVGGAVYAYYAAIAAQVTPESGAQKEAWLDFGPLGRHYHSTAMTPYAPDGELRAIFVFARNITEKQARAIEHDARMARAAEQETLHAAMIATAMDAIIVTSDSGIVEEFNPAAEALFGNARADVVGAHIGDFQAPAALRDLASAHERFLRMIDPSVIGRRVVRRWVRKDGSTFPMEITITRIDLGGSHRYMAHCRDLSVEHAQRAELAKAASLHAAMIAGALDGVILFDEDGAVFEFNPSAEAMFGVSRAEMIGRNVADDLVSPKLKAVEPTRKGRFQRMIAPRNLGRRLVREAMRRDGSLFPVETTITRIAMQGGHGYAAHLRDLSTERRQREELAEAEAARRAVETVSTEIIRSARDAFVLADHVGRIIDFNPAAETMLGHRREAAIGQRLSEAIIPPEHRAAHEAGMARYMTTGETRVLGRRVQLEALAADGERIPVEVTINEVTLPGRRLFTAHMRDLRESQRAQAEIEGQRSRIHQIEKLSAMGSLLAGVAHELNNPLAILVAQSTLLKEKATTADIRARAERIHAAAERSGRIIKSFLAMARQKPPSRDPADLNALAADTLEMLAYGLRSAGIETLRDFDAALPIISVDTDMIRQVMANLVLNAQQALASSDPPRRLILRTRAGRDHVRFETEDNGPGVKPETAGRIFDAFFTTKPAGVGTGIGLAICKDIAQAHDGKLELVPHRGAGALFRLTLPITQSEAAERPAPIAESDDSDRILIIDDERDVGESLADLLDALGHRAVVLSSANEGLQRAAREVFDRVFVDLRMPEMSGHAFLERLRDVAPRLASRAVLMTGDTIRGPSMLLGGRTDLTVMEKPFSLDDVKAVLARDVGSP